MPEQEAADLQILGQLQSQLHLAGEALARAEQQRNMAQAMMSQSVPVVDYDDGEVKGVGANPEDHGSKPSSVPTAPAMSLKAKLLAELNDKLKRGYTERHPDIRKLRAHIAEEEAKEPKPVEIQAELKVPTPPDAPKETATAAPVDSTPRRKPAASTTNPVLITQLKSLDADIAKQKQEQQRLTKQIGVYQSRLEAIPVRQQEVAELVRDYEISKAHYSQLLDKQLSAETATQLEIRQKGEKFSILDPAQPAERPSQPNRKLFNAMGALAGLVLGVLLALGKELIGTTITAPDQVALSSGIPVLEVIPVIVTKRDYRRRKRQMLWATVSGTIVTVLVCSAALYYRYRG
jgi:hypothetical protein